jgi:hypothetical protein
VAPSPRHGLAPVSPRRGLAPANGLPEPLKTNIEAMSGLEMDDVRVHRNSSEPARVGALAFARGAEIHLGAGQEEHLPHEAWHVVQQKQGRVRAITQFAGIAGNDDPALEREADERGGEALRFLRVAAPALSIRPPVRRLAGAAPVQRHVATAADWDQGEATMTGATKRQLHNGRSFLIGLHYVKELIVDRNGRRYWRKTIALKPTGGQGPYARFTGTPRSAVEMLRLYFKFRKHQAFALIGAQINRIAPIVVGAATPIQSPGKVMADYFLPGIVSYLSAADYALEPDYQWLHMHARGLGGSYNQGNLFAGSHAANSHMIALEDVLKATSGTFAATGSATWSCVANHHAARCNDIAAAISRPPAQVCAAMAVKPSHRLSHVTYSVQTPLGRYSEDIDPDQQGRFSFQEFKSIRELAYSQVTGTGSAIRMPAGNALAALLFLMLVWLVYQATRGSAAASPEPMPES